MDTLMHHSLLLVVCLLFIVYCLLFIVCLFVCLFV